VANMNKKYHLVDSSIDDRVILKWFFKQ
jgi:hypothetical protein